MSQSLSTAVTKLASGALPSRGSFVHVQLGNLRPGRQKKKGRFLTGGTIVGKGYFSKENESVAGFKSTRAYSDNSRFFCGCCDRRKTKCCFFNFQFYAS